MDETASGFGEMKQMREHIRQIVNSLECCWSCQRICECEEWLVNESVPVWLCIECVTKINVANSPAVVLSEKLSAAAPQSPGPQED